MNETIFKNTVSFETLEISDQIKKAIADMGYQSTTSIQTEAIPLILNGNDILGLSNTGSGKTAAFGIPALELIDFDLKAHQVLMIAPTRELADQISLEIEKYAKYTPEVKVATLYGGVQMDKQIRKLKVANIVVGTPGRIQDHIRRRTLKLNNVKYVVLDEADEMLSMGFIEDIENILSKTPNTRQTVLFSATMPKEIVKLTENFMKEPATINVMQKIGNQTSIEQHYYSIKGRNKIPALGALLRHYNMQRTIIFSNTKSMVDNLAMELRQQGFKAAGLHGDMAQVIRSQVLKEFRQGHTNILIATDVAARGIDIDDVDMVINFDLPQSHDYYVHRIGRTGRAGKVGLSITLISGRQQYYKLKELMRVTKNDIIEQELPTADEMLRSTIERNVHESLKIAERGYQKHTEDFVETLRQQLTYKDIAYLLGEQIMGEEIKKLNLEAMNDLEKSTKRKKNRDDNMVSLKINLGRKNKLRPNNVVATLTDTFDVSSDKIGKITIQDKNTFVDVDAHLAQEILTNTQKIKINGSVAKFELPIPKKPSRNPNGGKKQKKYKK